MKVWKLIRVVLPKPMEEICRDIDEELDFHIEQRAASFIEDGLGHTEALRQAKQRFGDLSRVRAELIVLATRRRRVVMMTGSTLLISALAILVVLTNEFRDRVHQGELEVSTLRGEVVALRSALSGENSGDFELAQAVHMIVVKGEVERERLWVIPHRREVTLSALIEKSGGLTRAASGRVFLTGSDGSVSLCNLDQIRSGQEPDRLLTRSLTVTVEGGQSGQDLPGTVSLSLGG